MGLKVDTDSLSAFESGGGIGTGLQEKEKILVIPQVMRRLTLMLLCRRRSQILDDSPWKLARREQKKAKAQQSWDILRIIDENSCGFLSWDCFGGLESC